MRMARSVQTFSVWIMLIWCINLVEIVADGSPNKVLYMDGSDCGKLLKLGAATVYSHHGAGTGRLYTHGQECRLKFEALTQDWKLQISIDYVDIPDYLYNGVCTDALYIYDSAIVGGRAFKLAGGNNGLCGSDAPSVITSSGPSLSVYFRTDKSGNIGKGFKFQVSAFTKAVNGNSCLSGNFYCKSTKRCVSGDLVCDRVSHCTGGEDEEADGVSKCKPTEQTGIWETVLSLGIAGFVGILVGALVVVILLIVCVVCTCRRCGKPPNDTEHRQSIPTSTRGSMGVTTQQQHMGKDGLAYHQVPQSAPSPAPYMMQNALNDQYVANPAGLGPGMGGGQGYTFNQQHLSSMQPHQMQRPAYLVQGPPIEMQVHMGAVQQQKMVAAGAAGAQLPAAYINSYNSPFHTAARGPESHSYSSGYSSQLQGPSANGFHPMHTKPIMSAKRGYTPTSGSSRSSRSRSEESSTTYSRGNHRQQPKQHRQLPPQQGEPKESGTDRQRSQSAAGVALL